MAETCHFCRQDIWPGARYWTQVPTVPGTLCDSCHEDWTSRAVSAEAPAGAPAEPTDTAPDTARPVAPMAARIYSAYVRRHRKPACVCVRRDYGRIGVAIRCRCCGGWRM